jgi:hypothetical protein
MAQQFVSIDQADHRAVLWLELMSCSICKGKGVSIWQVLINTRRFCRLLRVRRLMLRTFTLRSKLAVSAEYFWATQSLASVNEELHPLYRMTAPRRVLRAPIGEWPKYSNRLKSWLLFRGLIPIDRHSFGVIRFTGPTAFIETSSSWLNRQWRHERSVVTTPGGCEVTDIVSFEPRFARIGAGQKAQYLLAFRNGHEHLKSRHGCAVAA